jgi:Xaa-Pro aminopeptidase
VARLPPWIDAAPSGALTEIDAVEALETFRRQTCALKGRVVPTSRHRAERCHRALPRHPQSNRRISPGDLLLVDSGAQYETAPPTSTPQIRHTPAAEVRDRFTPRAARTRSDRARAVFP